MTSSQRIKKSQLNTLFSIILIILLILFLIYVSIAIYFAIKYNNTKKSLENFTQSHLQTLVGDLGDGASYDFKTDPLNFKDNISLISKDLIDNLLTYYDGNLNTVALTIRNLTTSTPPFRDDPPIFSDKFKEDVKTFSALLLTNIPVNVLYTSAYFTRFFAMILFTLTDQTKDEIKTRIRSIVKEIEDIIQKIIDSHKPKPPSN